jgi:hypothetical protein
VEIEVNRSSEYVNLFVGQTQRTHINICAIFVYYRYRQRDRWKDNRENEYKTENEPNVFLNRDPEHKKIF